VATTATATDSFLEVKCREMIAFKRPDQKRVNIDSGWHRVAWLGGELGLLAQRPIHPGMTSPVFGYDRHHGRPTGRDAR
jgi:hypothetical protein